MKKLFWKSRYCPGKHEADYKWPTTQGGTHCFALFGDRCQHYFDSWQQAKKLGWSKIMSKSKALKVLFVLALSLVGCGGDGTGNGAPATGGSPATHTYRYDVSGQGMTFAMSIYTNLGDADQHLLELTGPTFTYTIPDGNVVQYTPQDGRESNAQFALTGGIGTLTITRYRDGVPIDSQTNTMVGTSTTFAPIN